MRTLLLLLICTICMTLPVSAAFRYGKAAATQQHAVAMATTQRTQEAAVPMPQSFGKLIPNPDDRYSITAEGVFSLACAAFSIVSLIALSATSFSFFIIPAIIFGAAAVVFGAIGLHRTRKANAIIGMTVGFLGMLGALVALAAL